MFPDELCIINPTRMKKAGVIPGVIVDEAKQFARRANVRISIVMFHELAKKRIFYKSMENGRISLFTIPIATSRGLFKFVTSYPRSLVQTLVVCRSILKKNGSALIRSDDTILTGIPGKLLSSLSRKPRAILVAGNSREIASLKMSSIGIPNLMKRLVVLLITVIERIVISDATLLVISKDLARYYTSIGGRKMTMTPTYVDLDLFSPRRDKLKRREKTITLLFVGRLEQEKGITTLIQAFAALIEQHRNIRLAIVGDGSLKSSLPELIRRERLEGSVSLLGTVDHHKMPAIYQTADIFVLPSYTEGLPVSMLEAMASGLPVVVSPVGSVPRVVKHLKNGIHIRPGSVDSIVSAISRLLKNEGLRSRLAENGYHYVREFYGSYVDRHLQIYASMMSRSKNDR